MKAVFLDRDGTINFDTGYMNDPDKLNLIPHATEALKLLNEKGYLLFIVSNQSGVGRGLITSAQFKAVHGRLCELLKEDHVEIAGFCYCFHHPDDLCACRKPKPGLIPKEHEGKPIDFSQSFMVGDRETDVYVADAIGAKGCLVLTGEGEKSKSILEKEGHLSRFNVFKDLLDFASSVPAVRGEKNA